MSRHSIPSLDGMRAISILLVIVGHAYFATHGRNATNPLLVMASNSMLGVNIFFVISGFLITSILLKEFSKTGTINIRQFYLKRVFRIFPPFYFYIAVLGSLAYFGVVSGIKKADFISAILYVWDYSPFAHSWTMRHFWSLSVEEQFYLLWPVTLLFTLTRNGRTRAAWLCGFFILLTPVLRTASWVSGGFLRQNIFFMLHTRMDALMFGCLLALGWGKALQAKIADVHWRWPLLAAVFVFCLSPLLSQHFKGKYDLPFASTLDNFCTTVILSWLVVHEHSLVGKVLNSSVLTHVGVLSYSIYIWQNLFLLGLWAQTWQMLPVRLGLILACAEVSYFVVEKPFLRLRDVVTRPSPGQPLPIPEQVPAQ